MSHSGPLRKDTRIIRRQKEELGVDLGTAFCGVFTGPARQGSVNSLLGLASLKNVRRFWALGVVPPCLASDLEIIKAEEHIALDCKSQVEEVWLGLVSLPRACSLLGSLLSLWYIYAMEKHSAIK